MLGSLKGTICENWDFRSFFHWLNLHWFLQPEVMGTYLPDGFQGSLEPWADGPGVGLGLFAHEISLLNLSTTCGWETSLYCVCTPPTTLDGCDFFNSIVVRFPFTSISDGSQWWLFNILVVILMWVCEEANHVCLCHNLDQKWYDLCWRKFLATLRRRYILLLNGLVYKCTLFFILFFYRSSTLSPFFRHHFLPSNPSPLHTLNSTLLWLCLWVLHTCSLMTLPLLVPVTLFPLSLW